MLASTGVIKNMTILYLFQDIRKTRKTGTATFEQGAGTIKVFFRQGDIIFASSNSDDDQMRELLLRSGKITKEQLEKSSKIMAKNGKKMGAVLFEMGALGPQDLVAQAKLLAKQHILALFSCREGKYRFEEGILPGAEIVPFQMSVADLIIEAVRGRDWQEIRTSLPPLNTIIWKITDPSALFQTSHLDASESTVLSYLDGNSSIQDICNKSNLGDLKTLSAIYVLFALRIASAGELKDQEVKELLFQEERAAQAPAGPAAPDETLINRELLQNAYDSLAMQNYYEILGIGHSASAPEIRQAYLGLSKLYHPDRYSAPELADMKPKLATLFKSVNEAYMVLREKAKRDQYNLDLASGTKQYGQEEKEPVIDKVEVDKAAAVTQFNEGMKQMRVRNYWGAEEAFRRAARLDPFKSDYLFHLGLSLLHLPRRGSDAEECFIKAIKAASSRIEYYMELGNYYMKNAEKAKALPVFQAALKRDPNSEKIKQAVKAAGG